MEKLDMETEYYDEGNWAENPSRKKTIKEVYGDWYSVGYYMKDRFKIGLFDNVEWIGYDIANYGCDSVLLYGAKIGDNAKDVYETIVSNGWYGYEQEFGYSFMELYHYIHRLMLVILI